LPAVTVPAGSNAGLSDASFSSVASARIASSAATSSGRAAVSCAAGSTGTISSANTPRVRAAAARWWLRIANPSWSAREIPNRFATCSAVAPIAM
jgi:guanyl-specific ribonuclease Sa